MLKRRFVETLIVLCGFMLCWTEQSASQDRVEPNQDQTGDAFETVIRECDRSYQARDWDALLANMTEAGKLDFKRQTIASSFVWLSEGTPLPVQNVEAIREQLHATFESHGVTKLEVPNYDAPIGFNLDWYLDFRKKMDHAADGIMKQSMNHGGLMNDLSDALKATPIPQFGEVIFVASNVVSVEMQGDKAEVLLRYDPSKLPRDEEDRDEEISFSDAPYVVKFAKVDDQWKFDGMDMVRTWEEMTK